MLSEAGLDRLRGYAEGDRRVSPQPGFWTVDDLADVAISS
jgi:hypothetical protein